MSKTANNIKSVLLNEVTVMQLIQQIQKNFKALFRFLGLCRL